ncbi:MAG: LamG-like jellyroll fold domain-containing protein [Bacteroidota bacterium]
MKNFYSTILLLLCLIVAGITTASSQVKLDSGLVASYPFTGNASDSSGNSNNGAVFGATLTFDRFGNANRAYSFDGVGNYIQVPHNVSLNLTNDLTISTWVKSIAPSNNYHTIIAKRDESIGSIYPWSVGISYVAGVSGTEYKKVVFGLKDSLGQTFYHFSGDTIHQNAWEHILVIVRNDTSLIYLNGVLDSALAITIPRSTNTVPVNIGWNKVVGAEQMYGALDDIRLYNRALVDTEIQALYKAGVTTDTTTTWKLKLTAFTSSTTANNNFLGVAKSANDGFDPSYDLPEAPQPPGNFIQLYFPHPEWNQPIGNNFADDIRAEHAIGDTVIHWQFDVNTDLADSLITINFTSDGRIPGRFGVLLKDLTAGTRKNLKSAGMTYSYNSGAGGVRHFDIMVGDSTPPVVTVLKPNGGEIIRANSSYNLNWSNTDRTGIDSIIVYTSLDTGHSYQPLTTLHGLNTSYTWLTPAAYLRSSGSIRVTAFDSMGNSASAVSAHTFTLVGDSIANNFSAGWNLLGTALKPSNPTLAGTFGDNIHEAYYVYDYSPANGYNIPDSVSQGHGYWLGLLHNFMVDVKGLAITDSNVIALPVGFGIISDPLVVPVSKSYLRFRRAGLTVPYDTAIANGWITTGIQKYDPVSQNYQSVDTVYPWGGYWLGTLQSGVSLVVSPPPGNIVPLPKPQISPSSPTDWQVNIIASTSTCADQSLYFGVKSDATDGFDVRYDQPKPPAPPGGKYIQEYFNHPDWAPILGAKFDTDIKSPKTFSWIFTVAPSENSDITLSWDLNKLKATVPDSIQLQLTDNLTGTALDMKITGSYLFTTANPRQFTINGTTLGVLPGKELPKQFALLQNYPNPFNPGTIIRYQLPSATHVTLTVYNMLGQEISRLVDAQQEPGSKSVKFEMANIPSGVYIYRLNAGSYTDVKKMIFMK